MFSTTPLQSFLLAVCRMHGSSRCELLLIPRCVCSVLIEADTPVGVFYFTVVCPLNIFIPPLLPLLYQVLQFAGYPSNFINLKHLILTAHVRVRYDSTSGILRLASLLELAPVLEQLELHVGFSHFSLSHLLGLFYCHMHFSTKLEIEIILEFILI